MGGLVLASSRVPVVGSGAAVAGSAVPFTMFAGSVILVVGSGVVLVGSGVLLVGWGVVLAGSGAVLAGSVVPSAGSVVMVAGSVVPLGGPTIPLLSSVVPLVPFSVTPPCFLVPLLFLAILGSDFPFLALGMRPGASGIAESERDTTSSPSFSLPFLFLEFASSFLARLAFAGASSS